MKIYEVPVEYMTSGTMYIRAENVEQAKRRATQLLDGGGFSARIDPGGQAVIEKYLLTGEPVEADESLAEVCDDAEAHAEALGDDEEIADDGSIAL